ncbi:MAG TPA: glycosyltransferase [Candidatus Competibacteraceae bacterium]|nr:glycosyltransferase [Candidatus Competibacteraceae bacterium]MCP5132265.1 glycosyltransferase [Gammaproteobacteria bacterium]HPF59224.1 glycosyltransferase [Candidatus Competibacteraceae bacterium]HRY17641.1 glycosyltransferase [Candidatus Competibacteraceae bacterium]
MSLPLVSVAVPAYNHAPFLTACLESVRNQTYPRLELVIVDDGSTDDTLAVAECFAADHDGRFEHLTLLHQSNRGVSAASNRAIAACRGEWVHLLGSDDVLYPNKIQIQQQAIAGWKEPRLALVYSDVDFIDVNGQILSSATRKRPLPGPDHQAYLHLIRYNDVANATVVLRREAFLAIGGFDEHLPLEDLDCWLRLSVHHAIARVPGLLAGYRRHGGNTSLRQWMMFEANWDTLGKFAEQHGDLIPPALWRACLRRRLRSFLRWARKNAHELVPMILNDVLLSLICTPEPAVWRRYAARCRALAA